MCLCARTILLKHDAVKTSPHWLVLMFAWLYFWCNKAQIDKEDSSVQSARWQQWLANKACHSDVPFLDLFSIEEGAQPTL